MMADDANEMVVLELAPDALLRLYSNITGRMQSLGMNSADWRELGPGLDLPAGWPIDKDARPTLAELVVIARKLQMRITIRELSMQPLSETKESQSAGGLGKEATDGHDRRIPG